MFNRLPDTRRSFPFAVQAKMAAGLVEDVNQDAYERGNHFLKELNYISVNCASS